MNYVYEAWNDQHVWVTAEDVTVEEGPVDGIDAELSEGGEIRGTVTDDLRNLPIAGVEVCAESTASLYVEEGCAVTDAEGDYTIFGLAASSYAVEFWARPNFLTEWWSDQPSYGSADPVDVVPGEVVEDVDAALVPTAQITGKVTDSISGAPVPEIGACVFEVVTEFIGECGESDRAGNYRISGVAPGSYTVRFFAFGPYSPTWYTGSLCAEEPKAIAAAPGAETRGIDVQLTPQPFSPDCSPPVPLRPSPPPLEVLDVWSRRDGRVAARLRTYGRGRLDLVARTGAAFAKGRRHVAVAAKRLSLPRSGTRIVNLGLNSRGRALRQERGRLRARLEITFAPEEEGPFTLRQAILFKARRADSFPERDGFGGKAATGH